MSRCAAVIWASETERSRLANVRMRTLFFRTPRGQAHRWAASVGLVARFVGCGQCSPNGQAWLSASASPQPATTKRDIRPQPPIVAREADRTAKEAERVRQQFDALPEGDSTRLRMTANADRILPCSDGTSASRGHAGRCVPALSRALTLFDAVELQDPLRPPTQPALLSAAQHIDRAFLDEDHIRKPWPRSDGSADARPSSDAARTALSADRRLAERHGRLCAEHAARPRTLSRSLLAIHRDAVVGSGAGVSTVAGAADSQAASSTSICSEAQGNDIPSPRDSLQSLFRRCDAKGTTGRRRSDWHGCICGCRSPKKRWRRSIDNRQARGSDEAKLADLTA